MPNRLRSLCLAILGLAGIAFGQRATVESGDAARAIGRWRKAWAAGSIEATHAPIDEGEAKRLYGAAIWRSMPERLTSHRAGLLALLEVVASEQTPELVDETLALAAVGLEAAPQTERHTDLVRESALTTLGRLRSPSAIDRLLAAARPRRGPAAIEERLAAMLALGSVASPTVRLELEVHVRDNSPRIRFAAAQSLGTRGSAHSVTALGDALGAETDANAALAMLDALHSIAMRDAERIENRAGRRLLAIALDRLGKFDWRCDRVIVEIAGSIRSQMSIEPLIGVLERQRAQHRAEEHLRSGVLRERAFAVLRDLTGTLRPIDRPDLWREFWAGARADFKLPSPRSSKPEAGRTSSGFFGIPVTGTRVMFIIDTSGSMNSPLFVKSTAEGTSGSDETAQTTRIDQARKELLKAVAALPDGARFGVIAFASEVRVWFDKLALVGPPSTRTLRERLATLQGDGGTNLYGGLERALGLDEVGYGQAVGTEIDEIFLLSDGQPTAGSVTDPSTILAAVRRANRYARVRIHAVSLGGDEQFLRQLAEESGGNFVAY
ncbi:MAG: VWA domain-containing protein [Planctomycetota bacterium]